MNLEQIPQNGSVNTPFSASMSNSPETIDNQWSHYKTIRRNGMVVGFEPQKITVAIAKAFLATHGQAVAASAKVREQTQTISDLVVQSFLRRKPTGGAIHIEEIQDQVELALMRSGEHEVARAYVLYREKRASERAQVKQDNLEHSGATEQVIHVIDNGVRKPLDMLRLSNLLKASCEGVSGVDPDALLKGTMRDLYDGVQAEEVRKAVVLAASSLIETDPGYSYVGARLLLDSIRLEVLGTPTSHSQMAQGYAEYFAGYIKHGVKLGLLNEELSRYDLDKISAALNHERDYQFGYIGLQTLYDRYLLIDRGDNGLTTNNSPKAAVLSCHKPCSCGWQWV
jgi:ribonucleoside-diphosphate reductase alpha chain